MQVSVLLQVKGHDVVTVRPETTITDAVATMTEHRIGAVVVTTDATTIVGVLSERDVMTGLAAHGGDALDRTVADLMTTQVVTCQPDTTVEQLMATMTELRVRHVPVVVDGELAGVVSIGDVVKDRISVLEHETEALHNYISNPY